MCVTTFHPDPYRDYEGTYVHSGFRYANTPTPTGSQPVVVGVATWRDPDFFADKVRQERERNAR